MKYIRRFENRSNESNNDNLKNNIFLLDCSGSFIDTLKNKIGKINFYLSERFTAIFCFADDDEIAVHKDITLDELLLKVKKIRSGFGGSFQDVIDYLVDEKLQGNILLFTDGYDEFDLTKLVNNFTILSTHFMPKVTGGNCRIFIGDLESFDNGFYPPRDITYSNYELRASASKYNL